MKNKGGQVTIFIIIAIILVAAFALFLTLRGSTSVQQIPSSIEPVYTSFLSCLEEYSLVGISILETQGGYIEPPDFEPGSPYMPFSSQLDFLGNPVPYWYYVSGNNIQKEQVPSKSEIESQLGDYIDSRIRDCNFDSYYDQGFEIDLGEPKTEVNIRGSSVEVELDLNMGVEILEDNVFIKDHDVVVSSELGNLYDSAVEIYNHEQETLFLENYTIDVLRLYAPVDGVELSCSPMVWSANEVFLELQDALEANILSLKTQGSDKDYFKVDVDVNQDVRFLTSQTWPYTYEVEPSEDNILIAKPVGNQPGLGIIGFCYVAYHFVYDVKYPVLVQIFDGDEIFQFPMAIVIQGNNPREPLEGTAVLLGVPEVCENKNTPIDVRVYDTKLNTLNARISYECLGVQCSIGDTSGGILSDNFPQCVNGFVRASAEGYEDERVLLSTVEPGSVSLLLEKLFEIDVELDLEGVDYNGEAIIHFISEDTTETIAYSSQRKVELSEGQYEIQVEIYEDTSLELGETSSEECIDVPRTGVLGIFGLTEERCFEIEIPAQLVSNALAGGGKQNYYMLESELENSNTVVINAESLPEPDSLAQLQDNYLLVEGKTLDIMFK
ncbi:hypothetical protein ACFLZJ_00285 [Nanoarchaeota archaeon]